MCWYVLFKNASNYKNKVISGDDKKIRSVEASEPHRNRSFCIFE
ncbi:hypothetical protein PLEI_2786 [Photobacterium leiognathi lrivu.4.1]|uniref:Uncharacterized protein n=1 Tax=Photobacterium leiognathi lrivu.4.1 TaxID=1248232 RepID=A0A0U1P968_PHOLE|nr:hypothetical protein PLEI_2786 [Photobacterium leiognathi lrivu.4.1]